MSNLSTEFDLFTQEKDVNTRKGITRRSTSLRQTRTPQISLELQVQPLQSPVNPTQTATTTPKKSNWEVIEHFNSASKGRGSVSSSLIAVSKNEITLILIKKEKICDILW